MSSTLYRYSYHVTLGRELMPVFAGALISEGCLRLAQLMSGTAVRCIRPYPHRFVLLRFRRDREAPKTGKVVAPKCLPSRTRILPRTIRHVQLFQGLVTRRFSSLPPKWKLSPLQK